MNVSAEMYIVISLMFAVFAAVAAVGSSIVLGAGFERLRAGFEIIRKQTGFFADAIHKLDERTQALDAEAVKLREAVSGMGERVERVEKTTGFFSDAIHSLEQQILEGRPAGQAARAPQTDQAEIPEPILPRSMDWLTADEGDAMMSDTDQLLGSMQTLFMPERQKTEAVRAEAMPAANDVPTLEQPTSRLPNILVSYFKSETRDSVGSGSKEIVYH